jgi:hypothetical protein
LCSEALFKTCFHAADLSKFLAKWGNDPARQPVRQNVIKSGRWWVTQNFRLNVERKFGLYLFIKFPGERAAAPHFNNRPWEDHCIWSPTLRLVER